MLKLLNCIFLYLDTIQGVSKVLCSQGFFNSIYSSDNSYEICYFPCFAETVFLEQSLWTFNL